MAAESIFASTGYKSPASHGDDYNQWTNGANGKADDGSYAVSDASGERVDYYDFTLGVPAGAEISSIVVEMQAYQTTFTTADIDVDLSWNGGTSYTSAQQATNVPTSDTVYSFAGLWGRSWTDSELSNTNFRVRLTSVSVVSASFPLNVDYVKVSVVYKDTTGKVAVAKDTFTESTDTTLASHTPDTGTGYTLFEQVGGSNTLYVESLTDDVQVETGSLSDGASYYEQTAPNDADYNVLMKLKTPYESGSDDPWWIFGRVNEADATYPNLYGVQWLDQSSGGDYISLWKRVGSTNGTNGWTQLGSTYEHTAGAGDILELAMEGTTIKVYINGTLVISATDSSITAKGRAGFGIGKIKDTGSDMVAWVLDDFEVWQDNPVTNYTHNAAVTSAASSVPTATITAIRNVTINATVINAASSVPAPVVQAAAYTTTTVIVASSNVPNVVVDAFRNVQINAPPIDAVSSVPAPVIATQIQKTVNATVIDAVSSVPTVSIVTEIQSDTSVLVAQSIVNPVSVSTEWNVTINTGVIDAQSVIPPPVIEYDFEVSATAVESQSVVPDTVVSASNTISTTSIEVVSSAPVVIPVVAQTPSAIDANSFVPVVEVVTRIDMTINASVIGAASSVPAHVATAAAVINATVIATSSVVNSATVIAESIYETSTTIAQAIVNPVTLSTVRNLTVNASAVVTQSVMPAVQIDLGVQINDTTIITASSVASVLVTGEALVDSVVIDASSVINAPQVAANAQIDATVIGVVASVPSVTVIAESIYELSTIIAQSIVNTVTISTEWNVQVNTPVIVAQSVIPSPQIDLGVQVDTSAILVVAEVPAHEVNIPKTIAASVIDAVSEVLGVIVTGDAVINSSSVQVTSSVQTAIASVSVVLNAAVVEVVAEVPAHVGYGDQGIISAVIDLGDMDVSNVVDLGDMDAVDAIDLGDISATDKGTSIEVVENHVIDLGDIEVGDVALSDELEV